MLKISLRTAFVRGIGEHGADVGEHVPDQLRLEFVDAPVGFGDFRHQGDEESEFAVGDLFAGDADAGKLLAFIGGGGLVATVAPEDPCKKKPDEEEND